MAELRSSYPIVLSFDQHPITVLTDETGQPEWLADEVCDALGIAKARNALASLDDDEKGARTVGTPGGPQRKATINESGLYSLILRSRKPEAKRFKRWVTHEVLPAIRRTGSYGADLATPRADLSALTEQLASQQSELATIRAVLGSLLDELKTQRALPAWPKNGRIEVAPHTFLTIRGGEPVELRADGADVEQMENRAEEWFRAVLGSTHHMVPSGWTLERGKRPMPMFWESMRLRRGGTLRERFVMIRPGPLPSYSDWRPAHVL